MVEFFRLEESKPSMEVGIPNQNISFASTARMHPSQSYLS